MKEKKVIHNGKEYIFDEKAGKWKTFAENGQVSWAMDGLGYVLTAKLDSPIAQPNGKTKNVSYLGKTYAVPLSDFDTKNHTVYLKEFDAQFGKGDITETIPTIVKWDEKTKTWTANHNDPYKPTKTEVKTQVDNKTINRDTPPEGAKTTIPNKGEYVYTGGKWRHKSGDGYDFSANATNEKLLNEKVKNGDYEVWDNKAGGYVKGKPVARTAESIKAGEALAKKGEIPQRYWDAVNSVDSVKPQASKAGEALAKKGLAGAGVTNPTTREVQTEEGIETTKPTLGMTQDPALRTTPNQPTYSTYDRKGLAGLFDTAKTAFGGFTGEGDMGKVGEVAGYLPDVFKFALGMKGANEKLPEFEVPSQFTDYENRMRELSYQGLTDAELATGRRDLERSYAYDVNAIKNFAGGRPGVALANLGRAASSYQGGLNALNVADAQMQRGNLLNYGNVVNARVGMEQNAFNLKYQEAMNNKMAGAQLAADALSNIQSRRDYEQAYGDDSIYGQYQKSLLEGQEYQNEILRWQASHPLDLNSFQFAPQTINPNTQIPNFYGTYFGSDN